MNGYRATAATAAMAITVGLSLAAQAQVPTNQDVKPGEKFSFFVTSVGSGKGGDLGGLAGADAHCNALAKAAGSTNTSWRAYLSTQGPGAVNARDRIGTGPWWNAKGNMVATNLDTLHGDTIETALLSNRMFILYVQNEKGELINSVNMQPLQHDVLTGTQPDGTAFPAGEDRTCKNWTSSGDGVAMLGHTDRTGGANTSWNAAHPSRGCSQEALVQTGGAGMFYCFATEVK
jgi:hypothetical protein